MAVDENNLESVILLLGAGVDMNLLSGFDGSALHYAMQNLNTQMVQVLLQRGAESLLGNQTC